jgi:hypothetical protein
LEAMAAVQPSTALRMSSNDLLISTINNQGNQSVAIVTEERARVNRGCLIPGMPEMEFSSNFLMVEGGRIGS